MEKTPRPRRRGPHLTVRHVATGLLLAALALYVPACMYEAAYPWAGYLRAFAEAAMVGALADWFAVAALFRHPLGLPIPHTAVVQRNKNRIGEALGRFFERNFLAPAAIGPRLAGIDFAALLAQWLEVPQHRGQLADHLAGLLPRLFDVVKDEDVAQLAHRQLRDYLAGRLEVAPLVAEIIEMLVDDDRHQRLLDALLKEAAAALRENEPLIRERVSAKTSWIWRRLALDERVTQQIMAAAEEVLADLGTDPEQPWRQRFDTAVRDFIEKLKNSGEYRGKGEALIARLLDNPAVAARLAGLWGEIKRSVGDDARREDSSVRAGIREGLAQIARKLADDPELRGRLNGWLQGVAFEALESRRHEVSGLIVDTVRGWDPDTMAERIERAVGDDLQYIRINGTVIGGLAGLVIHAASELLF